MSDYNDGDYVGMMLAIYAGFLVFYVLVFAAAYVLMALALSSFFRKVGVEPWIAWVPVYSYWKWLEVGGFQGWLALLSFVPFGSYVTWVFLYIGMYRTGLAFRKDGSFVVLGIFLPVVWAFMLGSKNEVYQPELLAAHGYPPPIAGHGSVPYEQRATYQAPPSQGPQPYTVD